MNTPKTHNNSTVQAFLSNYYTVTELCDTFFSIDDIVSGVLELKTPGDSSTRTLSRKLLFHILRWCPMIDVASIEKLTRGRYSYNSLAGYATVARVASKAIESFIGSLPKRPQGLTLKQEREAIDAPYRAELEALGLV